MVVYEDCPEILTAAKAVSNGSYFSQAQMAFPCGGNAVPTSVLSKMLSLASKNNTFFVVLATEGIHSQLRGYPEIVERLLYLPAVKSNTNGTLRLAGSCGKLLDPMTRALSLTLSWMMYNSWTQLTVLYDETLNSLTTMSKGE